MSKRHFYNKSCKKLQIKLTPKQWTRYNNSKITCLMERISIHCFNIFLCVNLKHTSKYSESYYGFCLSNSVLKCLSNPPNWLWISDVKRETSCFIKHTTGVCLNSLIPRPALADDMVHILFTHAFNISNIR